MALQEVTTSNVDVKIYIGRFSPFHQGHAHVLRKALESSKMVIVLIGSAGQSRSLKNPFTFQEREQMIRKWHVGQDIPNEAALRILPIRDFPYNNALWIRNVQAVVDKAIAERFNGKTKVSIIGSDRDESTWYLRSFPQWDLELIDAYKPEGMDVSATLVRDALFNSGAVGVDEAYRIFQLLPASTRRFLDDFAGTDEYKQLAREQSFVTKYKKAWEVAPYAPIFVTVDAVVVQSGHVLVVRRGAEPGKGLWALPGGFLDQSETLRDGAVRELLEETGIRLAEGKKSKEITQDILRGSIRETKVFDKPDRSSRGRTITTAFLFRLDDTKPLPRVRGLDDAVDAFWVPINDALTSTDRWFEDHHAILETLIAYKDL